MSYKLIIISAAQQDFEDALAYYLNINIDTSKKFIDTIKDLYKKLKQHPHHYSFIDLNKNIREFQLQNFHISSFLK